MREIKFIKENVKQVVNDARLSKEDKLSNIVDQLINKQKSDKSLEDDKINNVALENTGYTALYDEKSKSLILKQYIPQIKVKDISKNIFQAVNVAIETINLQEKHHDKTIALKDCIRDNPHLAEFEEFIKIRTHVKVDEDEIDHDSHRRLKEQVLNHKYLFDFKQLIVNKKKIDKFDLIYTKQIIMATFFEEFLYKKMNVRIRKDKFSFFQTLFRLGDDDFKFKGMVCKFSDETNREEPIYLSKSYIDYKPLPITENETKDNIKEGKANFIENCGKWLNKYKYTIAGVTAIAGVAAVTLTSNHEQILEYIRHYIPEIYATVTKQVQEKVPWTGEWIWDQAVQFVQRYNPISDGAFINDDAKVEENDKQNVCIGKIHRMKNGDYTQTGNLIIMTYQIDIWLNEWYENLIEELGPINFQDDPSELLDLSKLIGNPENKKLKNLIENLENEEARNDLLKKLDKWCCSDVRAEYEQTVIRDIERFIAVAPENIITAYRTQIDFDSEKEKYIALVATLMDNSQDKRTRNNDFLTRLRDKAYPPAPPGGAPPRADGKSSKKSYYKKSPGFKALKNSFKKGEIDKDEFKKEKKILKSQTKKLLKK